MRVLMIAPPWFPVPPRAYGGTESVIDVLARGLTARGHELLLCTTADSSCRVPRHSILPSAVGVGAPAAVELVHVRDAYELAGDFDVVHDHTVAGPAYGSTRPNSTPILTTHHAPFTRWLAEQFRSLGARVGVIAISHDQARRAGPAPVAAVIHHGLDVRAYRFGDGRGGYAVALARMSPDKGIATAIRVARRAGIPLKIAAKMHSAAEHCYFREVIEPRLGGDVQYLGELSGRDKLQLLGGARCLLNPIAWPEPFGLAMIEALACGTPVVATPMGAAPEIVRHRHTGLLAASEPDLVRAVVEVVRCDRRACRRDVEQRFSMARMAADHERVYEQAAGPSRRRNSRPRERRRHVWRPPGAGTTRAIR